MRVGVVQIDQRIHSRTEVLEKALAAVEQAAAQDVQFLLFPELFSTGYIPNFELWNRLDAGAEFITALQGAARANGLYIGSGHAETLDGDVLNTYVVIGPDGTIIGRAVKENAESYIFRRGQRANLIRTSFGPVTVAICADNHFTRTLHKVKITRPVLHLMPHAWPAPFQPGRLVSNADIILANRGFEEFPTAVARFLGVPTVFVNQLGELPRMTGLYGSLMNPNSFKLLGGSKILNGDGELLAGLGREEGIAIADVPLTVSSSEAELADYGGRIHPGPRILRNFLMPLENWRGQRVYRRRVLKR